MWPQLLTLLPTLFDKIFPDQTKAQEAKARLLELQINGELDTIKSQLEVNKAEASSGNWFVAGWRPSIGWTCSLALFFQYIIRPLLMAYGAHINVDALAHLPGLDDNLWQLLLGMLGIGGLRTIEKVKGAAK